MSKPRWSIPAFFGCRFEWYWRKDPVTGSFVVCAIAPPKAKP